MLHPSIGSFNHPSKTAQEAHEAIRPTDVFRPSVELRKELPEDEFNLYLMIWKRAMSNDKPLCVYASQCRAAVLCKTQVITQSGTLLWKATGQVLEFLGYARYWPNLGKDTLLPVLQQGQTLTLENTAHEKKQTQPPPRYSEPKLVQLMERKGIGRPSTYAPTVATLKQRGYIELIKGNLQPTVLGLEVDTFLQKALPDLLEAEFTASMEESLDAIALGKQGWQQYLTTWNQDYFTPALAKAKTVVVSSASTSRASERKYETSKTRCPQCNNYLAKIPSSKLKKKYFLKCVSGCENVVLFWSDNNKAWSPPQSKATVGLNVLKPPVKITTYPCPVCKKPLEEYSYVKEGQSKTMLRCSDPQSRQDTKHKDVAYFGTPKGWWSPKFGELDSEK